MNKYYLTLLTFLILTTSDSAISHVDESLEEITVTGRKKVLVGEARSASEGVIGQVDIYKRPLQRPGDILEAVPGLICLLYTSPSPRDATLSRMPSSA